jgi:hypothetical protein
MQIFSLTFLAFNFLSCCAGNHCRHNCLPFGRCWKLTVLLTLYMLKEGSRSYLESVCTATRYQYWIQHNSKMKHLFIITALFVMQSVTGFLAREQGVKPCHLSSEITRFGTPLISLVCSQTSDHCSKMPRGVWTKLSARRLSGGSKSCHERGLRENLPI